MTCLFRLGILALVSIFSMSVHAEDAGEEAAGEVAQQSEQVGAMASQDLSATPWNQEIPSGGVPAFQPGSASKGAGRGGDVENIGSGVWFYSRCDFFWCACIEVPVNDACSQNFCFLDCQP